jgi:hypothetical protein
VSPVARVRVEGGLLVYHPSARCSELLEAIRALGIGEGVEADCVMRGPRVIGIELRYSCVYGGTFRRVMSKPHSGGLLSVDLEALRGKYRELLAIVGMYRAIRVEERGGGLLRWLERAG